MGVSTSSSPSSVLQNANDGSLVLCCNKALGYLTRYNGHFKKITIESKIDDETPLPQYAGSFLCTASVLDLCNASTTQTKLLCALLETRAQQLRYFDNCILPLSLLCCLSADFIHSLTGTDGLRPLSSRITTTHLYGFEAFFGCNQPSELELFKADLMFLFQNTKVVLYLKKHHQAASLVSNYLVRWLGAGVTENTPAVVMANTESVLQENYSETDIENQICRSLRSTK